MKKLHNFLIENCYDDLKKAYDSRNDSEWNDAIAKLQSKSRAEVIAIASKFTGVDLAASTTKSNAIKEIQTRYNMTKKVDRRMTDTSKIFKGR